MSDTPESPAPSPKPAAKPALRVRAASEPRDFTPVENPDQPAPVITHFKPAKPASSFNLAGLVAPLLVTAVIGGVGYFGYTKLAEQTERIAKAEVAASEADARSSSARRELSDTEAAIREAESACRELERKIEKEKETALNEAPGKAEAEFRPKLDEIARKIEAARRGVAEADTSAEGKVREAVNEMQRQIGELEPKVAELEKQVAELKAWLNLNNKTLHPKF